MPDKPISLILAAHGSLAAPDSNQPLYDLAKSVAALIQSQPTLANFSKVTPAFLNGTPEMGHVLEQLPAGDVIVVPVMTSDGYYVKKLPGIFSGNLNATDYKIQITPVAGVHDTIPTMIAARIRQQLESYDLLPADTTVVVVGHGTRRNPTSGESTFALTRALESLISDLKFETAFLDQDPTVDELASTITTRHTLVVPFLISRGPHSTVDVPTAFRLPAGPEVTFPIVGSTPKGKCICDLPVGMYPEIADVCLNLALDAKQQIEQQQALPTGERRADNLAGEMTA
ncbi:MAG: sirohydrochlorin cobaltochelatase [Mariniblastus sp.]|jgi:sirohydrochlorin cobaltochelatase